MHRKPLLMLTMPNSGSTWFAKLVGAHLPGCRYYEKEFFNPVCNLKYDLILRRNFGSELVSCYRNIASAGDAHIDEDIQATWGAENYNFTKECQSAFKLEAFLRHFRVFAFLRPEAESFPPNRARVWSFYEHAWHSLAHHGHTLRAETTPDRAVEAYRVIYAHIVSDAERLGVPVIYYADLFGEREALRGLLAEALGSDSDAILDAVIATRLRADRAPSHIVGSKDFGAAVHGLAPVAHGGAAAPLSRVV